MSTQDGASGIPFEICNEQQNLRLLELPPSLLELITSKSLTNLTLKSAAPGLSDGSSQAPANAVLCTDNQTFHIRQVQSSNSVFVLQPSEGSLGSEDDAIPSIALSAIAKCAATLELVPISPSAIGTLERLLPVYTGPESILALGSSDMKGKETTPNDVPFSRGEFDKAWKELCAFDIEGRTWVPTASILTSVWKSVISAATLRSLNLGDGFSMNTLEGVVDEEDGYPSALVHAVIDRLCSEDEDLMDGYAALNQHKVVSWVGATFLESQRDLADGILLSDFMQDWQNHLPEAWRMHAKIDLLKGKYSHPSKDRILFNDGVNGASDPNQPAAAKASGKSARKWHDKFKSARH